MFYYLLIGNFLLATIVSLTVICIFSGSIKSILSRVINDTIHLAWLKYIKFAGMVVGISSGVHTYNVEKYINPDLVDKKQIILKLTPERFVLEVYSTIIDTLQGLSWMFLIFFVVSLLAYVLVRRSESKINNNKES